MNIAINKVLSFPRVKVQYAETFFDKHQSDESPCHKFGMFNLCSINLVASTPVLIVLNDIGTL